MEKTGKNYKLSVIEKIGRDTFNKKLALTGAEISINELPAGEVVPKIWTSP